MEIIKVIVDEVPNSCWDCPRLDFDFKGLFKRFTPYCLITGKDIKIDYKTIRSGHCLLILEAQNFYDVSTRIWDNAKRVLESEE